MLNQENRPLRVLVDSTVLLDARHPDAETAREMLVRFAELTKRPGDLHTYRISPMSLWNAASLGLTAQEIMNCLTQFSSHELPLKVVHNIQWLTDRYGQLTFVRSAEDDIFLSGDDALLNDLSEKPGVGECLSGYRTNGNRRIKPECRGQLKQELIKLNYPVVDLAGYRHGEALAVSLLDQTRSGRSFALRDYQERAVDLFYQEGRDNGGSGVLVLPCGGGKTIVGIGAISRLKCDTLILTSNVTSVKQWKAELLDKTTLNDNEIGEYAAKSKQVRPITIATYQLLTNRRQKGDEYANMLLFQQRNWGLIIYDEVHLLPAPVFRMTADLQATRRLGLTATLVREDGREEDVFTLIGPKRFDLPWKVLETRSWIAEVSCTEMRIPLPQQELACYEAADEKTKARLCGENSAKIRAVKELLNRHQGKSILIIGQYLKQLHEIADEIHAPVLTGELPHAERERLFHSFRAGEIPVLVVSKVANFAVDLPDAAVAIQVSGSFGSRQEEAQRIGRIMRPKPGDNHSWFYTLVSSATKEIQYAQKRQLFLLEQGYRYEIEEMLASREAAL
ncbi:DNA repair helicase XPB [Paenibacillus solisilvae]|uniref:DNA 3'-5' helicase n=1 Tax=Paenibacillus solisilvae TaxID=2486751 RepID=A0ABW0W3A2_9BACL